MHEYDQLVKELKRFVIIEDLVKPEPEPEPEPKPEPLKCFFFNTPCRLMRHI